MEEYTYGLYLHIPFCRSRCRYCDFYSQPASRTVPDVYINALLRDFARYAPKGADGAPLRPATVYFGGGTPGLLTPAQVERILQAVSPAPGAEVTLETNPELALPKVLDGWRRAGVNRLSLGVQTARAESLKALGRLHTPDDARRALADARAAGFDNVSGDIMLALPGYTADEFDGTLALLQEGGAAHVSAYLLKIEEGTAFARSMPAGVPGPDEAAEFYAYAAGALQNAGYARYELSNFARPGYEGRHNLLYWDCRDVLGLGAAAHGNLNGRRLSFAPDAAAYTAGALGPRDEGPVDKTDYIMLRLRLAEGLSHAALAARFGAGFTGAQLAYLARLCAEGYVVQTHDGWALTTAGLMVENAILGGLL